MAERKEVEVRINNPQVIYEFVNGWISKTNESLAEGTLSHTTLDGYPFEEERSKLTIRGSQNNRGWSASSNLLMSIKTHEPPYFGWYPFSRGEVVSKMLRNFGIQSETRSRNSQTLIVIGYKDLSIVLVNLGFEDKEAYRQFVVNHTKEVKKTPSYINSSDQDWKKDVDANLDRMRFRTGNEGVHLALYKKIHGADANFLDFSDPSSFEADLSFYAKIYGKLITALYKERGRFPLFEGITFNPPEEAESNPDHISIGE